MNLVTGGAGYFGNLMVEQLRSESKPVRVFDISSEHGLPEDVEYIQGDIRDIDAVKRACKGADMVYHNVAMVPLAKDSKVFWSVNRDGTRNILQASLEMGVTKLIYTSSSAVFGVPERNPVDESIIPVPQEEYGRAKLAGESLCADFIQQGLDVTVIRPRTIMGHGRLGIMQILFEWIRQGKNVPVFGRGENLYQFVHAGDLASATIAAAGKSGPSVYNIGASAFGTMRETLQGLVDHANTGSRVVSIPTKPAVVLMKLSSAVGISPLGAYHALMYGESFYFDISKAQSELDWTPRHSNVEMFCQSYDWYLANRTHILEQKNASAHRSAVKQGILRVVSWLL